MNESRRRSTQLRISMLTLLVAAALAPAAARAQTAAPNGVIAIPVEEEGSGFDPDMIGAYTFGGPGSRGTRMKGPVARSMGGQMAQRLQRAVRSGHVPRWRSRGRGDDRRGEHEGNGNDGRNVQVNDPRLDHVVTFPGTRPFEFATQSETSAVMDGRHIAVGYNTSAGSVVEDFPGFGLALTQLLFSGYSTSHDGGKTWTSGFVPPVSPNAPFTFGDPVLDIDRRGTIYYVGLGVDATGARATVNLNLSTDHGSSFGPARIVAADDGADKPWLAVGPDPAVRSRDNVYVTWTSFIVDPDTGATVQTVLWLARSIDGGQTFTKQPIFVPVEDGRNSAFATFTNPVIDDSTGRLYVPFLHLSNEDADNVRVLVSDDGGLTFRPLAFNVPGAVDPFAYPNVTPGEIIDCNGGGIRLALTSGPDQGNGRFGLRRPRNATRLITQPHAAAVKGAFVFVLNSSTSATSGDPSARSEINAIYSKNGGLTWNAPFRVTRATSSDPQHVFPALSWSADGEKLNVSYYVQQSDRRLRTDIAHLEVDKGKLSSRARSTLSSTTFALTPSNIALSPTTTTNFDRIVQPCYDLGEYQTLVRSRGDRDDTMIGAWGDNRKTWIGPRGSPAPGPHPQPDVFSAKVEAQ
jgi:hypothetical protein